MKSILVRLFLYTFGRPFFQPFFELLFRIGIKGMNYGGGADYKISGERDLIVNMAKEWKGTGKRVTIFDIGANVGGYTKMVAEVLDKYSIEYVIYAFEPSEKTFAKLVDCLKGRSNLRPVRVGVGSSIGNARLFEHDKVSGLASLYDRDLAHVGLSLGSTGEVPVTTIDRFCEEKTIDGIDFLKIDVEGAELDVLKGASRMLNAKKIANIQFEFGGTAMDARIYVKDFFKFLESFDIFRILNHGLRKLDHYKESYEIFYPVNFYARRK